jgi:hypothetical protein
MTSYINCQKLNKTYCKQQYTLNNHIHKIQWHIHVHEWYNRITDQALATILICLKPSIWEVLLRCHKIAKRPGFPNLTKAAHTWRKVLATWTINMINPVRRIVKHVGVISHDMVPSSVEWIWLDLLLWHMFRISLTKMHIPDKC